jgi:hypothetical protein
MLIIKLVVAGLIVIATVLILLRVHREITGASSAAPRLKENNLSSNELESFIAAYRRDKEAAAAAAAPAPELTSWVARKSFLSAHTKLCYLVVKAALPDHHIFCNTRLGDALELHADHPLAGVRIDIVICNKELGPIAAIDVCSAEERNTSPEREKSERLQSAGLRYLRFTPGGIPKPAEVRDLIYRT